MKDNFPRGKISDDDEGAAEIAVSSRDKTVFMSFPKPTVWLGFPKETALALAAALIRHAESL